MTSNTLRVAAITLATLTLTTAAHAQRSSGTIAALNNGTREVTGSDRTRGFMLGVHSVAAPGIKITGGDIDGSFATTFGGGAGATVGYGFSRMLSAFASLDVAKQNTAPHKDPDGSWGLAHFEVGARANLPLGGASTVPYVTGSIGRRALAARATSEEGVQSDVTISGRMFGVGAGVEHFFSPTMALDAGVGVGYGKFDHFKADSDNWTSPVNASTSLRLRLGVTWRPSAGRSS